MPRRSGGLGAKSPSFDVVDEVVVPLIDSSETAHLAARRARTFGVFTIERGVRFRRGVAWWTGESGGPEQSGRILAISRLTRTLPVHGRSQRRLLWRLGREEEDRTGERLQGQVGNRLEGGALSVGEATGGTTHTGAGRGQLGGVRVCA